MKICILGWYGTETLGDRAILDGLFHIFYQVFGKCEFFLGTSCLALTERTLLEDRDLYNMSCPGVSVQLFDETNYSVIKTYVKKSELVIMGGGPIMDIFELKFVDFGFEYAKKCGIKTALLGCGIGTVENKRWINVIKRILDTSDLLIFRDKNSVIKAKEKYGVEKEMYGLSDPAALSMQRFKNNYEIVNEDYIVINYRKFPEIAGENMCAIKDTIFQNIVLEAAKRYSKVLLLPMHTFFIGGDDREYFIELMWGKMKDNIQVLQKPPTLLDTYKIIAKADAGIAMRYHCILMQTIINGNNYVLDYTFPKNGKISSFLQMIDLNNFYSERYCNLQQENSINICDLYDKLGENRKFVYKEMNDTEEIYKRLLRTLY